MRRLLQSMIYNLFPKVEKKIINKLKGKIDILELYFYSDEELLFKVKSLKLEHVRALKEALKDSDVFRTFSPYILLFHEKTESYCRKHFDYNKFCQSIDYSESDIYDLYNVVVEVKEQLENDKDDIFVHINNDKIKSTLISNGLISFDQEKTKFKLPTVEYNIRTKLSEEHAQIFKALAEGATLEKCGELFGVTKETIRLTLGKVMRAISPCDLDYNDKLFQYNFNAQEGEKLFGLSKIEYYYLSKKKKECKDPVPNITLKDMVRLGIDRRTIEELCREQNQLLIIGEKVELLPIDRRSILRYLMSKHREPMHVDQIETLYYDFLENNIADAELKKTHFIKDRTISGILDRDGYAIKCDTDVYRYFDLSKADEKDVIKLIGLNFREPAMLNVKKLYDENRGALYDDYSLYNAYELHYFLKTKNENTSLSFCWPYILINTTEEEFFDLMINKYGPIKRTFFCKYMEELYGIEDYKIAIFLQHHKQYIDGPNLTSTTNMLSLEQVLMLKTHFKDDYYNIETVKEVFSKLNLKEEQVTQYNLHEIGYNILPSGRYCLKKGFSVKQLILDKVLQNPFVLDAKDNNRTFSHALYELLGQKKIFKINPNTYCDQRYLEEEIGIKLSDLELVAEKAKEGLKTDEFVTLKSVGINTPQHHSLMCNVMQTFVEFEDIQAKIVFGELLIARHEVLIKDFLFYVINKFEIKYLSELLLKLENYYGMSPNRQRVMTILHSMDNIFFNTELEKIYRNQEEYFKEVYGE